jgi:hypothetical protein
LKILALLFAFVSLSLAADISGKWKADYTSPDGTARTSDFEFKADGEKLTGKVISTRGESEIKEGKIKGDEVTFVVVRNFNGDDVKIDYKGKISGDTIQFKVQFGDRGAFEMTARRATS